MKYISILLLSILIALAIFSLTVSTTFSQNENQDNKQYLRPPDFKIPNGKYGPPDAEIGWADMFSKEIINKLHMILRAISFIQPEEFNKELTSSEINLLMKLLTNKSIVGDGIYYDGVYGNYNTTSGVLVMYRGNTTGKGWIFCLSADPDFSKKYKIVARWFPYGGSISPLEIEEIYGAPHKKKIGMTIDPTGKKWAFEHLFYSNLGILFKEDGEYIGTIFFFVRPDDHDN